MGAAPWVPQGLVDRSRGIVYVAILEGRVQDHRDEPAAVNGVPSRD
jgi:hypothetical protein